MGCSCGSPAKRTITIKTLRLLALCGLLSSLLMAICGIAAAFIDQGTTSAYGAPIWSGLFVVFLWVVTLITMRKIKLTPSYRYVALKKYLTKGFTWCSFLSSIPVLICIIITAVRLIQKDRCLGRSNYDSYSYQCSYMPTELGSGINLLIFVLALVNLVLLIAAIYITSCAVTMITKDFGDDALESRRSRRRQTSSSGAVNMGYSPDELNARILAMAPPNYASQFGAFPPSYAEAIATPEPQSSVSIISTGRNEQSAAPSAGANENPSVEPESATPESPVDLQRVTVRITPSNDEQRTVAEQSAEPAISSEPDISEYPPPDYQREDDTNTNAEQVRKNQNNTNSPSQGSIGLTGTAV